MVMADVNNHERAAYRQLQEQFVSGHTGTTLWEIALVVSSAPAGVLLRNVIVKLLNQWDIKCSGITKFIIDYVFLILPVLGCFTLFPDYIIHILSAMTITSFTIVLTTSIIKGRGFIFDLQYAQDLAVVGKRPFITDFRAFVNIATAICILAVDFDVFPRRFAKAETYGSGLMDVGVGAYIISNAIVCPEARGKYLTQRNFYQRVQGVLKALKSTLPLWILGVCRCLSVKSIDYQEHVSEYGVHWNFFFTLAVVRILTSIVLAIFNPSLSWLLAITIASGYQYLLTGLNFKNYILHGSDGLGSRNGILEANREGIFSCLGYCAIYFAGVQIGTFLWRPRAKLRDWVYCLLLLIIADGIFWAMLSSSEYHIEPISRRLANLSFIIWMMSYNLQLISSFLLVDILGILLENSMYITKRRQSKPKEKSRSLDCLLEATNQNGLFYFLLANVLTGLINMLISTITTPPTTGVIVLSAYLCCLSAIVSILYRWKIQLKCW